MIIHDRRNTAEILHSNAKMNVSTPSYDETTNLILSEFGHVPQLQLSQE